MSARKHRLRSWTRVVCVVDIIFVSVFVTIVLLSEKYLGIFSSRMDIWFHLLQVSDGSVSSVGYSSSGMRLNPGTRRDAGYGAGLGTL